MFTGIIEDLGIVATIETTTDGNAKIEDGNFITIASRFATQLKIGESININGACHTVVKNKRRIFNKTNLFTVFSSKQTLAITNLSHLKIGDAVNLECSLTLATKLSGHFVYGHVDCIAHLQKKISQSNSVVMSFSLSKNHIELAQRYIVEKGSISLNGVSLTVYEKNNKSFLVMLIPHTLQLTTFSNIQVGDVVNVEFDFLGKYLENFLNR